MRADVRSVSASALLSLHDVWPRQFLYRRARHGQIAPDRNAQEFARRDMSAVVHQLTHVFLLVYAGLFPIVNPIGNAPIFLALTRYCTDRERRALALRVAINGFFLLLGSLFLGSYVLEFFGITLPVLRIAGGVVVAAFGWTLLQGGQETADQRAPEVARGPGYRHRCLLSPNHAAYGWTGSNLGCHRARQPAAEGGR